MGIIALIFSVIGWVFLVATLGMSALLLLRVIVAWITSNPFAWLPYNLRRVTEPLVTPLRWQVGNRSLRYDLMPLVMAVMILFTGLFISGLFWRISKLLDFMSFAAAYGGLSGRLIIGSLVDLISMLYVAAILLRWFLPLFGVGYRSSLMRFLFSITEPLLKPLRRYLVIGMLDLSPLAAIILVQMVAWIVISSLNIGIQ